MASILKGMYTLYANSSSAGEDSRVGEWFLMQSPIPILILIIFYVYFVLKLGPRLMANRKPFKIDGILLIYNAVQVAACLKITQKALVTIPQYNFWCQPVDDSSEFGLEVAKYVWFYFALKVCDLLDTVLFVLRKKQNQITFLHVYHHAGMVLASWIATKFFPGGSVVYFGLYNSVVHTIMYSYYFYTVWTKNQHIWWKKHLTQLQIVQFLIMFVQYSQLVLRPSCGFPKLGLVFMIPQILLILKMFTDFYIKTYGRENHSKRGECNDIVKNK